MFNYLKQIALVHNLQSSYNICNMENKLLYIEGQRGIVAISGEEISVRLKKRVCIVKGENLKILRMSAFVVLIGGTIKDVVTI